MCPTLQHVQAIPFLSGNMMSSEPIILGWFQHVSTRRSTIWSTAFHPIVIWFPRSLASGTSPSLCEPARLSDAAADLFFDPYLLPWKNSRNQYPPGNSGTWQWKMRPWKYWWSRNSIYMVGTCSNILEKVKILLPSSTSGGYTYRLYPKTSWAINDATRPSNCIAEMCVPEAPKTEDLSRWPAAIVLITFCTAYSLEGTKTAAAPGIFLSQVSGVTWNPTSSSIFLLTCQIILKTWLVDQLLKASRLHSQCLDAVPITNFPIRKSQKKGTLIVPEERDFFIFFPVLYKNFSPSSVGNPRVQKSISISSLAQVPGPAASHLRHLAASILPLGPDGVGPGP